MKHIRESGDGLDVEIANAPCSFGAFEVTVGRDPGVPDALRLLQHVADAGYSGIDLGPPGYLGVGDTLRHRLDEHGLSLAGGYMPLPFSDTAALAEALPELDLLLDVLDAAPDDRVFPPRPTLADAGSPVRARHAGRAALDPSLSLDDAGWRRFLDGLRRAAERCLKRGYEPTFHPHAGTNVESLVEIERVLEGCEVGMCLDSGHLVLGGGDPVECARSWGARVNHVHLKDVKHGPLDSVLAGGGSMEDIWDRRVFGQLGSGDVDFDGILGALSGIGYAGWIVVEQDLFPRPGESSDVAARAQQQNRAYLRARGL